MGWSNSWDVGVSNRPEISGVNTSYNALVGVATCSVGYSQDAQTSPNIIDIQKKKHIKQMKVMFR